MASGVTETASYWSFGIFLLGIVGMCCFMLFIPFLLGGRDWGRAKNEPFESGVVSQGGARLRVSAKFYLVAMFFVIFDVEAVFIFPWATQLERYGTFGLVEMGIFVFILLLGLVYAWRKGVLRWV